MKVLVTGANGFIGSALARCLLAQGHQVHCMAHNQQDRLQQLGAEIFVGDVTQQKTLSAAFNGVELVFHLAGRATDWGPRKEFFRINAQGTQNVLEAAIASGVRRLVLLSSLAVHRFLGYVDADETTPADQDRYAYGASKVAAERLVREAHLAGRIQTTIVRPGVVVHGPEDTTAFIHMAAMLESGRWTHVRQGQPLLCYSYVDNLVDGLIRAGTKPEGAGETFIITDDLHLNWASYISEIMAAFGAKERIWSFPAGVARVAGWTAEMSYRCFHAKNPPAITDYRTALVSKDFHFSCHKAKAVLGYQPLVSFRDGLERTVEWYRTWKKG